MPLCRQPIEVPISDNKKQWILAPCNKCPECLQRKKQQWIHRIECEKRYGDFKHCYFIGLSYNDEHLPYQSYKSVKFGVPQDVISTGESLLHPYDLRLFIERLRHLIKDGFSYFAVGEYGSSENTKRPHFHVILFCNCDYRCISNFVFLSWSYLRAETRHERYFRLKQSKKIGSLIKRDKWSVHNRESFGFVSIKSATYRRMCYVAKYVSKQFGINDVVPPFFRASNGLGKGFLKSDECKNLSASNTHYAYMSNGKPTALSRYFSNKMFSQSQKEVFNITMVTNQMPPERIVNDIPALRVWYHQQMCIEKANRRMRLLRMNNVLMV